MENTEKGPPVSLPTWLSEKVVLAIWTASFIIFIILSFFIFSPIAHTMNDTEGNCFLYAGSHGYGNVSVCNYCVACGIIFLVLSGIRLIILILKLMNFSSKVTDGISVWFNIWSVHLIILIIDVVLAILLLVTASLITAGLSTFCQNLFKGRDHCSSDVNLPNGEISTTFYEALTFAEGSAWFTLCYWLVVVTLETYFAWKNGSFSAITSVITVVLTNRDSSTTTVPSTRPKRNIEIVHM